jgi:hypothetical protein
VYVAELGRKGGRGFKDSGRVWGLTYRDCA